MKFVSLEVVDNIAIVTFHREPINAVSEEANEEIANTFEGVNKRDDIHCVIFRGEGKGFMSGSDTGDFDAFDDEALKGYEDADVRTVLAIENCRVPVIAQIQGYVMGLGTCVAAACDFIIAADDAYFGQPEVTICVVGGTGALFQLVPEKFMRYMAFTGKKIGIRKIAEFGNIYQIVPREEALDAAMELACQITANYTKAVQSVKAAIGELVNRDSDKEYRIDCKQTHIMLKDPERNEVLRTHNEKLRKKQEAKERAKAKEN